MDKILNANKKTALVLFILLTFSLAACGSGNKEYHADGTLKSIGDILPDGRKDGEWETFYRNGSPMSKGIYIKGEKEGLWTFWNKEGEVVAKKRFKDGVEISGKETKNAPKTMKRHSAKPEPEALTKQADEPAHKPVDEPGHETPAAPMHEAKESDAEIDHTREYAATMEEWKAMKARKEQMPVDTTGEDAAAVEEEAPAPIQESEAEEVEVQEPEVAAPVEEVEVMEPEKTVPLQEEVQPVRHAAPPVKEEVAVTEEEAPAIEEEAPIKEKKRPLSGKSFWRK